MSSLISPILCPLFEFSFHFYFYLCPLLKVLLNFSISGSSLIYKICFYCSFIFFKWLRMGEGRSYLIKNLLRTGASLLLPSWALTAKFHTEQKAKIILCSDWPTHSSASSKLSAVQTTFTIYLTLQVLLILRLVTVSLNSFISLLISVVSLLLI